MEIVVGVVVGLLVLMFLVSAHEFGHFIASRRNGVSVVEFGIGFPPRAIAWIKDPKTGRWRRLPKKEWQKEKMSRVVYSNGREILKEEQIEKPKVKVDKKVGKLSRHAREKAENHAELKRDGFFQRGMIFSINWLPIGGFCQMDGESDADRRKGTLGAASFWSKTKILFAGVGMNWLVAAVIFMVLAWVGMPEFVPGQFTLPVDSRVEWVPVQISSVIEESPAAKAGISTGDFIIALDGQPIERVTQVTEYDGQHAGEKVDWTLIRGLNDQCAMQVDWQGDWRESLKNVCEGAGEVIDTEVTLNQSDAEYLVGISMRENDKRTFSTWSAPLVGVGLTAQLTGETFKGLGMLVYNLVTGIGSQLSFDAGVRESGQEAISAAGESVSGPIGIIGVLFPAFTAAGPVNLAFLTALISLSLACMNVLPIPALDGGRWLLIAVYKLRKKKLTKEIEEKIVSRAFLVLLAIIFIVTVLDVVRIVT